MLAGPPWQIGAPTKDAETQGGQDLCMMLTEKFFRATGGSKQILPMLVRPILRSCGITFKKTDEKLLCKDLTVSQCNLRSFLILP